MKSIPGRQARDNERLRALEAMVNPTIGNGGITQLSIVGPTKVHTHTGLGEGGVFGNPLFAEGAAPGTPVGGHVVMYAKSDGKLYAKDDAGTEYDLTAGGGGGSVATDTLWDAAGDLAVGTGSNAAAKLSLTVPSAGVLNVLGVINGETTPTWKTLPWNTATNTLSPDYIIMQGSGLTHTSTPTMIKVNTAMTLNFASAAAVGVQLNPTITYQQTGGALAGYYGFLNAPVLTTSGTAQFGPLRDIIDDTEVAVSVASRTLAEWDSFRAHPIVTATGAGTVTITQLSMYRTSLRGLPASSVVTTLRGLHYEDASGISGTITTQIGVDIESMAAAGTNLAVRVRNTVQVNSGAAINLYSDVATTQTGGWVGSTGTLTTNLLRLQVANTTHAALNRLIDSTTTVTLDFASSQFVFASSQNTIKYKQAGSIFGMGFFFLHGATWINDASVSVNPGPINVFSDGGTNTFDTATGRTLASWYSFFSNPTFNRTNSGTGTITAVGGFVSWATVGAGITVTTRSAFLVADATNSGTLTTQVGLDIPALAAGTTNIGIRNVSNYRGTGYFSILGTGVTPTNVTSGDGNFTRLKIVDGAFGTGVDFSVTGDGALSGFLRVGSETAPSNTAALTANRALIGTDASFPNANVQLWVNQATIGNEVMRLTSTATNDDVAEATFMGRVATSGAATATTIVTIPIPATTTVFIVAFVYARRTGGSSGTAEDGYGYIRVATYKNVSGTATEIAEAATVTQESDANANCVFTPSGSDALLQVTGVNNNDISWHAVVKVYQVGS